MAQQTPWLRPANFSGQITLPTNFNYAVFDPYVYSLERNELRLLLGVTKLAELVAWVTLYPYGNATDSDATFDPAMVKLYRLVADYLVYAAYAQYVFKGDLLPTDTGLVRKERENSESISDTLRMQLRRDYLDEAAKRAADITDYLKPSTDCGTAGPALIEVRISSARGRTKSGTSNW